jgi:hypothetical protein
VLRKCFHLAGKDLMVSIIVSYASYYRRVDTQGHCRKGPALFGKPTHELSGNVLGIPCTAAIAAEHDLSSQLNTQRHVLRHSLYLGLKIWNLVQKGSVILQSKIK